MSIQTRAEQDPLQYALDFFTGVDEALRKKAAAGCIAEQREAVTVHDGLRLHRTTPTEATRYQFEASLPIRLRVGEPVQCVADGNPPVRGFVTNGGARTLTLDLEVDLGPRVRAAMVLRDAAGLERSSCRRLVCIANGVTRSGYPGQFWPEHSCTTHPPGISAPTHFVPLAMPTALSGKVAAMLNWEQRHAVNTVLAQPVSVICGPPGTRTGTTIAAAVAALAYHGQRVLVITRSDASADVFLTTLYPWLEEHPLICRGVVQRGGGRVTKQLASELRELFVPTTVLRRLNDEYDSVQSWLEEERATAVATCPGDVAVSDAELAAVGAERRSLSAELLRNALVTVAPAADIRLIPDLWLSHDAVITGESSMLSSAGSARAAGRSRSGW